MAVSYKKDFFIFQGKYFKNWNMLNDAGYALLLVIRDICSDPVKAAKWYNNIDSIVVTSQDRTERNDNHSNGQAIDITVYPLGMNLWVFKELREYKYTVYVSSFNRHIHFDLREAGLSGVEVLRAPGALLDTYPKGNTSITAKGYNIRIEAPERMQTYLYKWYEAWKLKDLKAEIWGAINSPFVGTKKAIQFSEAKTEEWIKENIPALSWLPWAFGGIVALIILSKMNDKKYIVVKGER